MFDRSKLKGRIVELYGSQAEFAKAIGKSEAVMSNIMQNKTEIQSKDVPVWAEALKIEPEDIGLYFFTKEIRKS